MESYGDWMFDRRDFEDAALGMYHALTSCFCLQP